MTSPKHFYGPNIGYVLDLYERYLEAPDSVDAKTAEFFQNWSPDLAMNGGGEAATTTASPTIDMRKVVGAVEYAQAIRQFGHLAARLDPLGNPSPDDPTLYPAEHGITDDDLKNLPPGLIIDGPVALQSNSAYEAIQRLKAIYCSTIGYDNEHIHIPEERNWLREAIESRRYRYEWSDEQNKQMLERLTQVEAMEHFLQRVFPSKYRFSVEGLDMMIPMLDEVVRYAGETARTKCIYIGMAHRGRLNVLAHIMHRDYQSILAEFKDTTERASEVAAIGWTVDDVKYHKGATYTVPETGMTIKLAPNPSHLEAVNPVVVGMARAAATKRDKPGAIEFDPFATLQVLIHGDAAFPGQGIVAETFNMSKLPGFSVGGTLHIIANNQLGFTTVPLDGRSTLYASDLAKGFQVPIVHVNADDPAACIEVARLAAAYTAEFEKDFLIDLVGYRRYGHNELDEPGFTQPLMYQDVRQHDTVRKIWAGALVERGDIKADEAETLVQKYSDHLQSELDAMEAAQKGIADIRTEEPPKGIAKKVETKVEPERLTAINDALTGTYEGFNFYSSRFEKTIRSRRTTLNNPEEKAMDWGTAEEFAFATILADGIPIRFTGQEAQRGTFSHRHSVLHDANSGAELVPLQEIPQAQAAFEIRNSPLSEEAVLGFEYGYNIEAKKALVIWEAQYGDFVNTAQNIIDEFIVSAREKWGETPSLVMLLPHGHEGAGPDHSSARPERFLLMAAKTNMRIANPTTAGQYFHLLRRQALLLESDPLPLIVMSPKSLLRNPAVAASMNDLTTGKWQPVIDADGVEPDKVKRLVFCSGKFYYDLAGAEFRDQYPDVAIVRVEQLYPFPLTEVKAVYERYPNIKQIVWAQEEPKNMGAWEFMGYRLKKLVGMGTPVNYVGRRRSSSPAEGSKTAWTINQAMVVEYAFDWDFESNEAKPRHK